MLHSLKQWHKRKNVWVMSTHVATLLLTTSIRENVLFFKKIFRDWILTYISGQHKKETPYIGET